MSENWVKAIPLSWGLGMSENDHPVFGTYRALISVDDEAAGPYLRVEFTNDDPDEGESTHMGFFFNHEDIDRFAEHLHHALSAANEHTESN